MPLPLKKTNNPLIQRIAADGVLTGGGGSRLAFGGEHPFQPSDGDMGEQTDFGAINTAANAPANPTDLFSSLQGPSLANLGLHPSGGPTTSYAPTGLRQQAIAAGGAPVTGFGGVQVSAAPNAFGGMGFNLMQGQPTAPAPGAPGSIDPNPTPAAMQFLQDGIAPDNPGPFPRFGGQPGAIAQPASPAQTPFGQPNNDIFKQPQSGLGAYIPRGNPEQIKAQLGVLQPLQKMHQEAIERSAIAAAHGPGVKDGLNAYLAAGGRDIGVIDSFKKNTLAEKNLNIKQGALDTKAADAAKSQAEENAMAADTAKTVVDSIDKIIPIVSKWDSGVVATNFRNAQRGYPGTEAFRVEELKKPILSAIATDKLQAMRKASKTGASGFGALSEKELDLLEKSRGSLESAQDPKDLAQTYGDIRNHFEAWRVAHEAGQKASSGTLSPQDQARAILAIRRANAGK